MTQPLSPVQLESLRAQLAKGARRSSEDLQQRHATGSRLSVDALSLCPLADFPRGAVCDEGDLVAGAVARFEGRASGTALLAVDPADALAWVRGGAPTEDPIARYLELAERVLVGCLGTLAAGIRAPVALAQPVLVEDSVVGILLATHAPSDTLVLSVQLTLEGTGLRVPVFLYALVDAKLLTLLADAGGDDEAVAGA